LVKITKPARSSAPLKFSHYGLTGRFQLLASRCIW
jgi:hypothetical protein